MTALISLGNLRFLSVAFTAAFVMTGVAFAQNRNSGARLEKPSTVTITAGLQGLPYLPLLVAEKKGVFGSHNLTVNTVTVAGGSAVIAVAAGRADMTVTLPENIINAYVQGGTVLKIVGALVTKDLYGAYVNPSIKTVKDLIGKKIAIFGPPHDGVGLQLLTVLDGAGVKEAQVQFVSIGGLGARLAALTNNQVSATLLFPPFDLQAERAGYSQIVNLNDYLPGYPNEVIATSPDVIKNKAPEVRAFLAAIAEAVDFINANEDEAMKILIDATGADPVLTRSSFNRSMKGAYAKGAAIDPKALELLLAHYAKFTGTKVDQLPSLSGLYDPSFLPK